ncbi:hypothetical protein AMTR_s00029p00101420 [Amborella trichopoda]|uniref:Uncharacterized protein n=1 Tax=Amborella trichopoda TaxID=13333 RepID=W1PNS4_AMBTC|nr:hypothetical protein AMTR_s00029p00101420 [Amborella trichopoda]
MDYLIMPQAFNFTRELGEESPGGRQDRRHHWTTLPNPLPQRHCGVKKLSTGKYTILVFFMRDR